MTRFFLTLAFLLASPPRVLLAALLCCALTMSSCAAPDGTTPLPQHMEQMDPQLAGRIVKVATRLAEDPDDYRLLTELGTLYEANGLQGLAALAYEQVLAQERDQPEVWFRLAVCRERQGELGGAIEAMEQAAQWDTQLPAAQTRLAMWLLDAGRIDDAEEAARRARELTGDGDEAQLATIRVHLARNDPQSATELARSSGVLAGPNGPYARHLLSVALRKQGRLDEAAALSTGSARSRPVLTDPWSQELAALRVTRSGKFRQARRLLRRGEFEQARAVLEDLQSSEAPDPRIYNMMAQTYLRTGLADKAQEVLTQAIALAPGHFGTRLNLAKVLLLSAQEEPPLLELALEHIDAAIALRPTAGEAYMARGAILLTLDRADAAVEAYERGWSFDARDPSPLLRAGAFLVLRQQFPQARHLFGIVLRTAPGDSTALLGLARCAMAEGRLDEAGSILDRVAVADDAAQQLAAARARLEALRGARS